MAKFTKLNIGDSVASSGGRVWKKLSAESAVVEDELAGTWYFNDKPNQNYRGNSYTGISFTVKSHGTIEHNRIDFDYSSRDLFFYQSSGYSYIAYDHSKSAWWASGTRTIHVTTLAKDSPRLLDFLKNNATKQ